MRPPAVRLRHRHVAALATLGLALAGCSGSGAPVGTESSAGSAGLGPVGGSMGSGGAAGSAVTVGGRSSDGGSSVAIAGAGPGGSGGSVTAGNGGSGGGAFNEAGPIGFASLNGGTTGGKDGQMVTVKTFAELTTYAESAMPHIILIEGTIENGANGGVISVKSNKSLIGVGGTAFLNGVGLDINNSNNIIIQNLRLSMTGVTTRTDTPGVYVSAGDDGLPKVLVNDGDTISIRGSSKNIWIDHCELFSQDPAVQDNHDLYDGLIDIKGQTGFITISWNYLHDHHKGGLVGASDSDLFADRKVTLHHNYYDNVKLRIPMYRGSVGHFFNNYVVGAQDATEIRAGTCVRVEKNYYEPLHYSIYTPSDAAGMAELIDNIEVMRTERDHPAGCTADIPYPYEQALTTTTSDVKTLVPESAGVGKL